MRKLKKILVIVSVFCMIAASAMSSFADTTVSMVDMHVIESDNAKVNAEAFTDSYGNGYASNIVEFRADNDGFISYDLNGAYSTFEGTIVSSNDEASGSVIDVGIFADGVLKYSLTDYTRQKAPENFTSDVSGVGTLTIKTKVIGNSGRCIYFVNSRFNKIDKASIYPVRSSLYDQVMIDSKYCNTSKALTIDPRGDLHNGELLFKSSVKSHEAYAMLNLGGKFVELSGTIVASSYMDSDSRGTIIFYLDDKEVYRLKGIKKTSDAKAFKINVKNGKVLKISLFNETDDSCYVSVTDTILKFHEHVLSDWETAQQPTCDTEGKKVRRCTLCGEEIETEVIPALGHKPDGKWVRDHDSTCAEEGADVQHCTVCGKPCESRAIPKLPHTSSDKWVTEKEPTCEEKGTKVLKCSVCGEVLERQELDIIPHDYGNWKSISGSFWNNPIHRERTCNVCGYKDSEDIYPTDWLKPLVVFASVIIIAGIGSIIITLKLNNLPLAFSSIIRIFKKESVTDEEIEALISRQDVPVQAPVDPDFGPGGQNTENN